MTPTQNSDPRLNNLKPWPKGKSGNPGGLSKKVRAFRRECEKLLPEAAARLADLLRSSDADDYKFALEWIRKAFIPVPKEGAAGGDPKSKSEATLPDSIREKLARWQ